MLCKWRHCTAEEDENDSKKKHAKLLAYASGAAELHWPSKVEVSLTVCSNTERTAPHRTAPHRAALHCTALCAGWPPL